MSPMLSIPVFQVHLNHRSRINWRTFLAQFGLVCSEFVICSNMNSKRTLKMFFWFHILILNCCCAPNPGWTETVTKRGEETSETRSSVVGSHGSLRICDKVGDALSAWEAAPDICQGKDLGVISTKCIWVCEPSCSHKSWSPCSLLHFCCFFANTVAMTSSCKEVMQIFHLELREQMLLSRAQEFLLGNLPPAPGQAGSISIAITPLRESWIRWSEMKLWKGRSVNLISPVSSSVLLTNQEGRTVSVDHAWERMKI